MTTVSRPNRDALDKALGMYLDAMRPFIVRNLRRVTGASVSELINRSLPYRRIPPEEAGNSEATIDENDFPAIVRNNWREIFSTSFNSDMSALNALWQIKEARNSVAHRAPQDMDPEYVRAHFFHIADMLGKINAPDAKQAVEEIRDRLFNVQVRTPALPVEPESEAEEPAATEHTSQPLSPHELAPWRDVILPNPDVSLGTFQESEFAANLQRVHDGSADATQYGNPVSFFDRTYITPGLQKLLLNTLRRLAGNGGDPVIQTKTGFGGGKTHSLIALYHLVKNLGALTNPAQSGESATTASQIRAIVEEAGLEPDGINARVAVLVGTHLATTDPATTENGDPLNTLWGEMAYQLGGLAAYDIIGDAARQRVAPGGRQLGELFQRLGPCVILIDELVAYVRNAGDAQDNIYTFIQNLTESVSGTNNVALVVTLPESAAEAGGEAGMYALSRLDSILGRIEAVWEPLEVNEAFEVVRRRLFGTDIDHAKRDQACQAFSRMYSRSRRDYPQEAGEQNYLERMKVCYPIHPEIFDRLYSDWSSIHRFQRTRGVLRLLAQCVSRLYLDGDSSPLIMPANLPLDDPGLRGEFISILGDQWRSVLSEADSDNSRTDVIDKSSQRFGRYGVSRRLARAIVLGSAPGGAVRGIDAARIHLGVVQPGQGVPVYNEALARMTGDLYHLYSADGRYYFHVEENLNKLATDRADTVTAREIADQIRMSMEEAVSRRSDVVLFPVSSGDVPDRDSVRLVILPHDKSLPSRTAEDDEASAFALDLLMNRGDAPRIRKNTLVFLATRRDEVRQLDTVVRNYLAWDSIRTGERSIENLAGARRTQVFNSVRRYDREVRSALVNAYRWALAPFQPEPHDSSRFNLSRWQIGAQDTGEIVEKAFAKFLEEEALADKLSPDALHAILERHIWNRLDHISIDDLWDLMAANVYMQRLRNKSVLLASVREGVPEAKFGYAERYTADTREYRNLIFGDDTLGVAERDDGVLVNPVMAQMVKDELATRRSGVENGDSDDEDENGGGGKPPEPPPPPQQPRAPAVKRILVNKVVHGQLSLDDISPIRDEIVRTLMDGGGEVTISVTISATNANGFSESIARAVRENSLQLGLDFEEGEE